MDCALRFGETGELGDAFFDGFVRVNDGIVDAPVDISQRELGIAGLVLPTRLS